ncbi:unnamed protein product [Clavelina lepadiformis]|uniref:Uncharacterized protein n=1 Tax=Clavelina lepadiformis TaxID=159417 RepID=A0ABP0GU45_CLALP
MPLYVIDGNQQINVPIHDVFGHSKNLCQHLKGYFSNSSATLDNMYYSKCSDKSNAVKVNGNEDGIITFLNGGEIYVFVKSGWWWCSIL